MTLYSNLDSLSLSLNKEFTKYTNDNSNDIEPVKHITLVGAVVERKEVSSNEYKLSDNDYCFLQKALEELHKSGIPLAKNFQVDVVNLSYGKNFLDEKNKTDLVLICNLPPEEGKEHILYKNSQPNDNNWRQRIEQSGAKIVINSGWNNRHLSDDLLIGNSAKVLDNNYYINQTDYNGNEHKIDMQHSIIMTKGYTEEILPYLDQSSEIRKNIMAIQNKLLPSNMIENSTTLLQHQGRHR